MEFTRFDNIVGIKTEAGEVFGFHARNLQVAALDQAAWAALKAPTHGGEALSEIESWNVERDERAGDAEVPNSIRMLSLNIAQLCNLKCGYCAAGGDGTFGDPMKAADLPVIFEQLRALLHDVPSGELFRINFFGGEPTLAPEAIRSVARFAKLQVAGRDIELQFSITTNGTLITPEIAELLASLNCAVTVSLDGPPEINDVNRPAAGGKSSTAMTLKGLRNLQPIRKRLGSLNVNAVFGKHNLDILGTYKFLQPLDFDSYRFEFAASENDAEVSDVFARELARTAQHVFENFGEQELRKIATFDAYFRLLDNQSRIHNHCGAGKSYAHSDARGRLSACHWFAGDTREQVGAGSTIDHQKLEAYKNRLVDSNDCGQCWARHLCGGGCMFVNRLKTGSKFKKDEQFCSRTRNIIGKAIELYAKSRTYVEQGV